MAAILVWRLGRSDRPLRAVPIAVSPISEKTKPMCATKLYDIRRSFVIMRFISVLL